VLLPGKFLCFRPKFFMPRLPFGVASRCLYVLAVWTALTTVARGQTVWSGPITVFTKPADGDPTQSENQDRLTDNVWLTRGFPSSGGIYNIRTEAFYDQSSSPSDTEWATSLVGNNSDKLIAASNHADLDFTVWAPAFDGPSPSLLENILSHKAVVHLITDDIYFDVRFTDFGIGFFTYRRSTAGFSVEPTGDYNGDHVVDAADYTVWRDLFGQFPDSFGGGADGDQSGIIDQGDYEFWRSRFGNLVPEDVSGLAVAAPEPSAVVTLLIGLLTLATIRRLSPRGPGQG